jgi:hypothetical protein
LKKHRYLTKKKEREERAPESKKPGIDPAIIEESGAWWKQNQKALLRLWNQKVRRHVLWHLKL